MRLQIDKLGKVSITIEEDYWSPTKDYDKLTIVEKAEEFGTFISRKPVPAGIPLTNRKYWINFSRLKEEIVLQFGELVNRLNNLDITVEKKEEEIYKAMASLTAGGIVLKQSFGDSEFVGISQKVITKKVDELQDKINSLHPGSFGINIIADKTVVFDDSDTNVAINAIMVNNSIADVIRIKINNIVVAEQQNVSELSTTELINSTVIVKAEAIQETLSYENSIKITGTKPYYVGAGNAYTDIISDTYKKGPKVNPNGTYSINIPSNLLYVFFIVPATMTISKATMSGFDFPLELPQSVIISGAAYKVYRSSNTYDAGTMTIIIS